ncbi:hypothetical protein LEP1GSC065_3022 [Leptospira kirschneri serovar Sokoine str. RM1]|nr:hypothetical protein LEP1GSC198_2357 [Leptospira kirschneri str. JB]EMK03137.1 hypothetical protein LEP1GSC166_1429 [Leptospira kirschneri]EMN25743.1 hypothetical protein LEP1GSC065_3022 [Leptospira kirschneri serovar Sokoine str. RM1]
MNKIKVSAKSEYDDFSFGARPKPQRILHDHSLKIFNQM